MSVVDQALVVARESDDLLVIVGPTASGKTELAVALAQQLRGEIVSADSVQVYRGFDIGSGKPTAEELERAPHHFISAIDPLDPIDAGTWAQRASQSIAEIRARGRTPIVCGGSFLWVKALLLGLAEIPPGNAEIRARHRAIAEDGGRAAFHARLSSVDAEMAARLHPNDFVRVSRALEVHELTGKTLSAWHGEHAFGRVRHRARMIAVAHDMAALTARIRVRAAAWLAQGWVDEVEALVARGFGPARAMSSVGYAQIREMLEGTIARPELLDTIVRKTRIFARRQRTWLSQASVTWVE